MRSLSALNAFLYASLPLLVASVDPYVELTYSKYIGQPLPSQVTQWLGMRYATPPILRMRFSPPADPYQTTDAPQVLTKHGPLCIPTNDYPINELNQEAWSEDCLFLNVFAPTNATTSSQLPVFVYIQGGGFDNNAPANVDGASLVAASNNSMVVVTFNYRVGPFGFLTGVDPLRREQPARLTANNGFKDQRKALEWVQNHIRNFGGDPKHIVLGGSSASLSWHLTANDGQDTGLFHAVAGGAPSWNQVHHYRDLQNQYDDFIRNIGCYQEEGMAEPQSICIRLRKSWQEIRNHTFLPPSPGSANPPSFMWGPVIDDDLFKRTPYEAFQQGKFVKVPVIFGHNTDSGRSLTPREVSTVDEINGWLKDQFPFLSQWHFKIINKLYPNSDRDQKACPSKGCRWKQLSRMYTDITDQCPAIFISGAFPEFGFGDSYNYRFNVEDPLMVRGGLGVPAGIEAHALFGPLSIPPTLPGNPVRPESFLPGDTNAAVVDVFQAYLISFIKTFNPNTLRLPGSTKWETYRGSSKTRLRFDTGGKTEMERVSEKSAEGCNFFQDYIWGRNGVPTTEVNWEQE